VIVALSVADRFNLSNLNLSSNEKEMRL